jgi:hypothetical protein
MNSIYVAGDGEEAVAYLSGPGLPKTVAAVREQSGCQSTIPDLLKINLLPALKACQAIQRALLQWAWNRRTSIEIDQTASYEVR